MKPLMKPFAGSAVSTLLIVLSLSAAEPSPKPGKTVPLFDGVTLAGWEGDAKLWRVQDGSLTGGSLTQTVKQNEFLATTRDYTNFILRFKIKLTGTNGFINSGFQIRSQRVPNNSEMAGYQCDFGEPNWYGAIYDESRRNKVMSASDMKSLRPVIKKDDWNDYVIRADGERVTTWINGVQGTDYIEADPNIPDWGKLGIQVHGGGKALVQVKDISIEELPTTPPGKRFIGAPEPKKSAKSDPLSPEEERAAFTLPPGFEIELVAAESEGIGKFVAIDWDLQGRLWTMTALEYPVDANESPAVAKELYASKAKDKVLVFDRDAASPTGYSSRPRVFAEGLAIPLGVLPYKNGVYVQHGSDIVFLSDTDADGKADKRETILSGFGVQDSHLFPHQFTRAPGNWIWMAQGAFNYGKVRTTKGSEVKFDQTRMARFRYDGSDFDITSQGPCNIWGLAMTAEGETWIQEANDYGYPAMPFHAYANYPGCSDAQMKSYAPEFPGTAPDFKMGGTGLSGLALSDAWAEQPETRNPKPETHPKTGLRPSGFPPPYADIMYVANPITRKIQAIKIHREGPRHRLQKLPDFIQSSDEMFRPVALRTGPDGCLYLVDWYNKIISHNEVPRNHPERDKKRGRIWRVRHKDQTPFPVPDFTTLSGDELLARLGGESTTQSHLAWQAITDRQMKELAPKLKEIVIDREQAAGRRIASLWALEGLDGSDRFGKGAEYFPILKPLLSDSNRNLRREAIRVLGTRPPSVAGASELWVEYFNALDTAGLDPDPEVRAEVIKTTAGLLGLLGISSDSRTAPLSNERALPLLVGMARPSLAEPTAPSTHSGKSIKVGEAYEREFERYLVRMFLENRPEEVAPFLDSQAAKSIPVENRLVATLALEPKASASRVAELLPQLTRPPGQEEVARLAQFLDEPGAGDALKRTLQNPATSVATLEALLKVRTRLDPAKLTPLLTDTARALWPGDSGSRALALRLITGFKLAGMEAGINESLTGGRPALAESEIVPALRAMRELGASRLEGVLAFVKSPRREVADEALVALSSSRNETAPASLFKLWPGLNAAQRRSTLNTLTGTRHGALATVKAMTSGIVTPDELSAANLDKLNAVLNNDTATLMQRMESLLQPVVRFEGKPDTFVWTKYRLAGPFTVECWLKLDSGINNQDGILSSSNQLDLNFFDSSFRVWVGGGQHDIVVAKRKTVPDVWTHYAVSRNSQGVFRIYVNGELDATSTGRNTNTFDQLDVGRTNPKNGGTAGWMNEFRVWNVARSAAEIRADFDRTYRGDAGISEGGSNSRAPGLMSLLTGTQWPSLHGAVKIQKTLDAPPLLSSAESKALAAKFSRFHALSAKSGDTANGKRLFMTICQQCHSVGGQGGQVGPTLSGAGAMGVESLLRNLLTPNAAMEPGYRVFRVELKDGDVLDGLRVSEDNEAIVLRRPNVDDTRIAQKDIVKAGFTRSSMMPEGLLDVLKPEEVTDLFSFLKTLK